MVHFFDEIPKDIMTWVKQQKMFWVASSPLAEDGHINLSPKGFEGTFHIVDPKTVWYEDMSGSGVETISHIRENGRLVIMFCAFEGPPQIIRFWGKGAVHEYDTPEYNALIPLAKRQPGSRSVIMLHITKVSTSCGFSIPFYTFRSHRMKLHKMAAFKESKDIEAEAASCSQPGQSEDSNGATTQMTAYEKARGYPDRPSAGLKGYWEKNNARSIDGLPALQDAFRSTTMFDRSVVEQDWESMKDDESIPPRDGEGVVAVAGKSPKSQGGPHGIEPVNLVMGIMLGMLITLVTSRIKESFKVIV